MIYLFDIQISWMFGISSITTMSGGDDWVEEFLEGFIGFFVTSDDTTGLDHWMTLKNELDLRVKMTQLGVHRVLRGERGRLVTKLPGLSTPVLMQ